MCKTINDEDRAFWEAIDAKNRALRDKDGKIPGKKGRVIWDPQTGKLVRISQT